MKNDDLLNETLNKINVWVKENTNLIKSFEIKDRQDELALFFAPKNLESAKIELIFSKHSPEIDICIGSFFCLSDYEHSSCEKVIKILEAVKHGKYTETVETIFGLIATATGEIHSNDIYLQDKDFRIVFFLSKIFPSKKTIQTYKPWF